MSIRVKGPRFSQSALAIDAAISGQGIALTSEQLVERDLAAGRLCRLFDFALHLSLGYYVVYPEDRRDCGDYSGNARLADHTGPI